MSFEQNYGVRDPVIEEDEEPIFTKAELHQMQIDKHLEDEEYEIEQIKETWRVLNEE